MLGKTANGLFWMYRYLERADFITRLVETGQRIALTRTGDDDGEWRSVLQAADALASFSVKHDEITRDRVIDWLLRDTDNAGSVRTSIGLARRNARTVRTALTHDTWEAINLAYMTTTEMLKRKVADRELPKTLERIRDFYAQIRGATSSTMLRNDIYNFIQLGTHIERADNTARILDVKYYVLLPASIVGSDIDNVQWEILLRSVSALGGFRLHYGSNGSSRDIAHFLILDQRMPRSLAFCAQKLARNLAYLDTGYAKNSPSTQLAVDIAQRIASASIDDILDAGLHEFIQLIIRDFASLGSQVEVDFRFYD